MRHAVDNTRQEEVYQEKPIAGIGRFCNRFVLSEGHSGVQAVTM